MHSIYSTKTLLFYNANQPRDSMASAECLICGKTLYLEPWNYIIHCSKGTQCTTYNFLTCSKRPLHWVKHSWFSLYSLAPTPLTRTITTFCILLTLVNWLHLGYWHWPILISRKVVYKIKSWMLEILSGAMANCPSPILNRCCAWGMTSGCSKNYSHIFNKFIILLQLSNYRKMYCIITCQLSFCKPFCLFS